LYHSVLKCLYIYIHSEFTQSELMSDILTFARVSV